MGISKLSHKIYYIFLISAILTNFFGLRPLNKIHF